MRKLLAFAVGAGAVFAVVVLLATRLPPSQPFAGVGPTANASAAEDGLLHWPLPPGAEAFAAIDGRRMHQDVVAQSPDLAPVSRRRPPEVLGPHHRDVLRRRKRGVAGRALQEHRPDRRAHPAVRPGAAVDAECVERVGERRRKDARRSTRRSRITLRRARRKDGLDLEGVYVGLGSEADYASKNVRGKAVFVYTQVGLQLGQDWTALAKRAESKGAAAYLEVDMLPGNMRYQGYPANTKTPSFTIGSGDGFAVRDSSPRRRTRHRASSCRSTSRWCRT